MDFFDTEIASGRCWKIWGYSVKGVKGVKGVKSVKRCEIAAAADLRYFLATEGTVHKSLGLLTEDSLGEDTEIFCTLITLISQIFLSLFDIRFFG